MIVDGWEPGGGGRPHCVPTGAVEPVGEVVQTDEMNSIFFFDAASGDLIGMWTLPRPLTLIDNCAIHNYNIIPLRDRYFLVHRSYQSGTSVVDVRDPATIGSTHLDHLNLQQQETLIP